MGDAGGETPRRRVSIPFIAGQWSLRRAGVGGAPARLVSIPFIAGQWSLPRHAPRRRAGHAWFQSPSLRGSGRFSASPTRPTTSSDVSIPFIAGQWSLPILVVVALAGAACFNPLHCGAVVASQKVHGDAEALVKVSIPFIAGQWSLRVPLPAVPVPLPSVSIPFIAGQWSLHFRRVRLGDPDPSFNPLHCGAVVASRGRGRGDLARARVSIPFIAGQWSLHGTPPSPEGGRAIVSIPFIAGQWSLRASQRVVRHSTGVFQSPSLRGSGRFRRWCASAATTPKRFNPLHCGAVVASYRSGRTGGSGRVSIPFIAGQWSLHIILSMILLLAPVSIPFIAGQWSLPPPKGGGEPFAVQRFNPLHCGAVVASLGRTRAEGGCGPRFNPLHCGAVVASFSTSWCATWKNLVSIPFIAGQWSLPILRGLRGAQLILFQSPSLRGSGRFKKSASRRTAGAGSFNPLHCGAVVASGTPTIIGSLLRRAFQSPSLRGSGRFCHLPYATY